MITVRKMIVPDDYEAVSAIMSDHYSEEVTVEKMKEEDAIIPAQGSLSRDEQGRLTGHDRLRLVALDSGSRIIGYAHAWRAPWSPPGVLYEQIIVDRSYRQSGAGRAIFEELMSYSAEVGAHRVTADVRDNDPDSVRFAAARGFKEERRLFESVIELHEYKRQTEAVTVRIGDIELVTLADLPDEESERKLYDLYSATHPDIPGFEGEFMWYGEWRKRTLEREDFNRSHVLLAKDGDRLVGAVELRVFESSHSVYNDYTCVDAAYRGRGIASALKKWSIDTASKEGFRYIRTNNDSLNVPMLAVNRKLGFKPVPGYVQMVLDLAP